MRENFLSLSINDFKQGPIRWSLYLPYKPLDSTLSRVDLYIEQFTEEVSRANRGKSQWKERNDSSIVLVQTAGSKRIHAIQELQKKVVLFINLRGKGLTQEINGDRGSIWWAPALNDLFWRYMGDVIWLDILFLFSSQRADGKFTPA